MMCQCTKWATLAEDVYSGKGCACAGAGGIWEISVTTPQCCYESKTALKHKVYLKVNTIAKLEQCLKRYSLRDEKGYSSKFLSRCSHFVFRSG